MEEAAMHYDPEMPDQKSQVAKVKAKHEAGLMARKGVEGVGVGRDALGNDAITVYVRDQSVAVPDSLDGVPVVRQVTGVIDAQRKR